MSFSSTDLGGRQFHRDSGKGVGFRADTADKAALYDPFQASSPSLGTPRAPAPPVDDFDGEVVYATGWSGSTLKITAE